MAESKTKTREEAIEETLQAIEIRYQTKINDINEKINYAINDGFFSITLDYVPEQDIQIYFRDGYGYSIGAKETNLNGRTKNIEFELSWQKIPQLNLIV